MQAEDSFTILASRNLPHFQSCSYGLQGITFNPAITAHKSCPQLRLNIAWNYCQNSNLAIGDNLDLGKSHITS